MKYILWIFLFLSVLLEGLVTTMPLIVAMLILFYILTRTHLVFLAAFVSGIAVDILRFQVLGGSSIYFLFIALLVTLYERKFEIATVPFLCISTFLGSLGYLWLFHHEGIFVQAIANAVIGVIIFYVILRLRSSRENPNEISRYARNDRIVSEV